MRENLHRASDWILQRTNEKVCEQKIILPSNTLWAQIVRECCTMHHRRFPHSHPWVFLHPCKSAGEPKFAPGALGAERKKEENYKRIHFHRRDSATYRNSGYRW